jgi:hypothetical protein
MSAAAVIAAAIIFVFAAVPAFAWSHDRLPRCDSLKPPEAFSAGIISG